MSDKYRAVDGYCHLFVAEGVLWKERLDLFMYLL